jgi:hypothetical protein
MQPQMQILPNGAYPFLRLDDEKLLKGCRVDPYQASGPGGQKRNRKYSAVRITHLTTGLTSIAEESRSQIENRARALNRLRKLIALNVRQDCPSEQFRIAPEVKGLFQPDCSLRMNVKNPLYPIFCATILDAILLKEGRIGDACAMLGISSGQLGRLLRKDYELLTAVNRLREHFYLKPLRISK